jgi:hypothetical protein
VIYEATNGAILVELALACSEELLVIGMTSEVVLLTIATGEVAKRFSNTLLGGPLTGLLVINRPTALTNLEESNLDIYPLQKTSVETGPAKLSLTPIMPTEEQTPTPATSDA